jgi:hypothetical protein
VLLKCFNDIKDPIHCANIILFNGFLSYFIVLTLISVKHIKPYINLLQKVNDSFLQIFILIEAESDVKE